MKRVITLIFVAFIMATLQATDVTSWPKQDGWSVSGDTVTGNNAKAFLVSGVSTPKVAFEVKADVKVEKVDNENWSHVAIVIYRSPKEFLQLSLVEAPKGAYRIAELKQQKNGKWGSGDGFVKAPSSTKFNWSENVEYELSIKVTATHIIGTVEDENDKVVAQIKAPVKDFDAGIFSGKIGVRVSNASASFSDIEVDDED